MPFKRNQNKIDHSVKLICMECAQKLYSLIVVEFLDVILNSLTIRLIRVIY